MDKNKRNALGRGLDSLISMSDIQTDGSSTINEISLSKIEPNPEQPRDFFNPDTLQELADSIKEVGIIQPLLLRAIGNDKYQIIAGERRWRAAQLAGLNAVPAYVKTASDSEVTAMALIENIQRQDLTAIEIALSFKKLIDSYHLTHEQLAKRLSMNRTSISNYLRLLNLPADVQIGLRDRKVDMGHARALLALENTELILEVYSRIVDENISVREVENVVKKMSVTKGKPAQKKDKSGYEDFCRRLQTYFPSKVKFSRNAQGKGTITLSFKNDDELQKLVTLFEKLK